MMKGKLNPSWMIKLPSCARQSQLCLILIPLLAHLGLPSCGNDQARRKSWIGEDRDPNLHSAVTLTPLLGVKIRHLFELRALPNTLNSQDGSLLIDIYPFQVHLPIPDESLIHMISEDARN
ncbi:hypothetical protein L1987_11055 [Smallanthus sonchifolius]|uniref:Uncharacterized protein n=1 Tax=Smallanthus sonchifolius TaxID=185202 RepID=A0ACB9JAT7_9ASTR|nr:hypothetical protein L1987_11055 [Smallanthus sonchifolius]